MESAGFLHRGRVVHHNETDPDMTNAYLED